MDHTTTGKGPSSVGVHQCLPHPSHQVGYQRLRAAFGSKILWFSTQMHPNRNIYFWTSHRWELVINMLSTSSINLNSGISRVLDMRMHHNKIQGKEVSPHNLNGRAKITSLRTTHPNRKWRKVIERWRKTLRSGARFIKSLGTKLMNVKQNSHWWPRWNP